MEVETGYPDGRDQLRRSIQATDKAIRLIREGEMKRRNISLELRDLQLTLHEDFNGIQSEMSDFEQSTQKERHNSAKWIMAKLEKTKKEAEQAIRSNLLNKDVELLEKKVAILKESMVNVNKAYYKYDNLVDVDDLKKQITEMSYRTEKKEAEMLKKLSGKKLEEKIEESFRGAIEGLLSINATDVGLMKEAKELASELRVYRDISANENFLELISRDENENVTTGSKSTTGSEVNLLSSEVSIKSGKVLKQAPLSLSSESSSSSSAPTTFSSSFGSFHSATSGKGASSSASSSSGSSFPTSSSNMRI